MLDGKWLGQMGRQCPLKRLQKAGASGALLSLDPTLFCYKETELVMDIKHEADRVITGQRLAKAGVAGLAAFLALRLTVLAVDTADRVHDFVTEDLFDFGISAPESFHNPPATIEVDDTNAVFEAVSSRLVHEKTEHIENVLLTYDNRDQSWLSSSFAGAKLPEPLALSGDVTAKVSLKELTESGIRTTEDGQGLIITLPKAELGATEIDEDIKFELDHGFFNDATGARETEEGVRIEADRAVTDTALANGLLEVTEQEAAESVRNLAAYILSSREIQIEPENIEVRFEEPDSTESTVAEDQPTELNADAGNKV